jgi:NADH:ubiquinone oxidoreductase subunit K
MKLPLFLFENLIENYIEQVLLVILFFLIIVLISFVGDLLKYILISELSFLILCLLFLNATVIIDDIVGQFVILVILTIAAMESAFGMALLIYVYHVLGSISLYKFFIKKKN